MALDHLLRRTLEQTLIPSPNVTALAPSKASGFVDRVTPDNVDVGELFHLNSRLSRHQPDNRLTAAEMADVHDWYFTTCGRHRADDFVGAANDVRRPHAGLSGPLAQVLAPFGTGGRLARLLYACDLMVVDGSVVCRQQPDEDALWVEHRLGGPRGLADAVPDAASAAALRATDQVLVLVGVPWRTMLGGGPRGYRRMLMDAGVLLDVVLGLAQQADLRPRPVLDFYDDEIDTLLHCDGLERSALALVPLLPPAEPLEKSHDDDA
ncbi:hypothetical protein I6A84_40805 [Frankia sp. CNm7]|uniref:Nitroreductase domain-containing protein n=1 Tax=Frankia nepalensis TaxID=1836974 RepID=A0A937RKN8_9ACTN|nr:hypothetical protein [Frankia nepalensis]MBL7500336.1 hypothetical protein [Frankia nepalensis]MBL7508558.1 hypothetical protein [Frankia nepalensis]MBL7524215.1 hypothetical protein [Frankia nepalensis]MBL7627686.1 hypothetical protein [Frankia nepalensis]